MKITALILVFLTSILAKGQLVFKTVVPQQAIVAGESFQVQYTIQDGEQVINFKPPNFSPFRLVSGPNVYHGSVSTINGVKPLQNIVYTLVAQRPGKYIVYGASAFEEGVQVKSNDAIVEVITREAALARLNKEKEISSDYVLRPGENAYEKVRDNLFLKVLVDRTSCYVGEPVLATFKLYSRLESRSDIVKNPGFYGFTVFDMVNLADKQSTQEQFNGKTFDVHTIRKVQLYPLQAGDFTIDAMEVTNKVEFSKSAVNRKTEQEIVEGVLNTGEETANENTTVVETSMNTPAVKIHVKELPVRNKPDEFNGALGDFTVLSRLVNPSIAKNEEGIFEIILNGKGNFIQISAPAVKWPAGIEGFDPTVINEFDKSTSPLSGKRVFRYGFIAAQTGEYVLPAVQFSFFNPDSGRFITRITKEVRLNVTGSKKTSRSPEKTLEKNKKRSSLLIVFGVAFGLLLTIFGIWIKRKKRPLRKEPLPANAEIVPVDEFLKIARKEMESTDRVFFTALQKAIWDYFHSRLVFAGSEMNKKNLAARLKIKGISIELQNESLALLELCESGMFTNANLLENKERLIERTRILLSKIESSL